MTTYPVRLPHAVLVALFAFLAAVPSSAQKAPAPAWAALALDGTVDDQFTTESTPLDTGHYAAAYVLIAETATPFEFVVTATDFVPVLVAIAPSGVQYHSDGGKEAPSETRLQITQGEAGMWVVVVTTHGPGEVGGYRLAHRGEPGTEQPGATAVPSAAEVMAYSSIMSRVDSLDQAQVASYGAGRYAEAAAAARERLALREAALGPNHPIVATDLNVLALLLNEQGDPAAARPLYERALAIYEAALGPDHLHVALTLSNLAALLRAQGDYAAARPLYERALAIREAALDPNHLDVAESLSGLALLLLGQGDYAAARPLFERALTIREAALGPDAPAVALGLNNLAAVFTKQGDPAARPLYERALAIYEAAHGPNHPTVVRTLNNLAVLLHSQEDFAAARPLYERALAAYEAEFGPDHLGTALLLNNLAAVLAKQGEQSAARPMLERAVALREATLGSDHPDLAQCLSNLAVVLDGEGDLLAARPLYARAARIYSDLAERVLPMLAPAEQQAFVTLDLGRLTGLLLSTHRDGAALSEVYGLLGGWKGLLLYGLRRQTAVTALADDSTRADDVARLTELRSQVAHAFRSGDATLAALTAEKERVERQLARTLPEGTLADPWQARGFDSLRLLLPTDALFCDLYRYHRWERGTPGPAHYAAVVVGLGASPALVDLGEAEPLETAVAAWRAAVTAQRPAEAEMAALADALWGPLAAALPDGTARVWVSPDGDLARVPWAALAAEHEATADLLVAQVPSARDLLTLLTTVPEPEAAPSLLLVGGVDFGEGSGFAPLPGTEAEVDALAALADAEGLRTTALTARAPTAEAVATALPRATYAHLATHGFFYGESEAAYAARGGDNPFSRTEVIGAFAGPPAAEGFNRNPLAESGLALAGANAEAGGTLTAEELVGLDLSRTRLVVLSACDTGRGAEVTGQGVFGLQASLTAAGARSLVMSLWKVPDASTAALMQHFYRGLWEDDLAPAEALRRAQAAVRATPGWEAPVHWAAWVLAGEGW